MPVSGVLSNVLTTVKSARDRLYSTVENVRPKVIIKTALPKPGVIEKIESVLAGGKLFGGQPSEGVVVVGSKPVLGQVVEVVRRRRILHL